jgi:hypothetical protein
MDYGVVMFPTEYSIAPDELARALEERGFESVWFPEHTHIPASRKSPWPGGGELPRDYWSAPRWIGSRAAACSSASAAGEMGEDQPATFVLSQGRGNAYDATDGPAKCFLVVHARPAGSRTNGSRPVP